MEREPLRDLLMRHVVADEREAHHRARMLELVVGHEVPWARDHFTPGHFTASAFVLAPDGRDLLLIFHSKLRLWLQPGGHIDRTDEDVTAAARREVGEETGLWDVGSVGLFPELVDLDVHRIPANPRREEPAHYHFDLRILLQAKTREVCPGSDAMDARWVPLADLDTIGTDESVRRAARKILHAG